MSLSQNSVAILFLALVIYLCRISAKDDVNQGKDDDSVCFNNCNDHGQCIDYTCYCEPGYHGDACEMTYAINDGEGLVPILTAGHFNITSKAQLNNILRTKSISRDLYVDLEEEVMGISLLIIGFSSIQCHRCIVSERDYKTVSHILQRDKVTIPSTLNFDGKKKGGKGKKESKHNVVFGRIDISSNNNLKSLALDYGALDIPSLVLYPLHKGAAKKDSKGILYHGHHHHTILYRYIRKLLNPPSIVLDNMMDVQHFLKTTLSINDVNDYVDYNEGREGSDDGSSELLRNALRSTSFTSVIGFFTSPNDMEEDEYDEYIEIAKSMQYKETIYFGTVIDKEVIKAYKAGKIIDRTPSVLLYNTYIDIDSFKRHQKEEENDGSDGDGDGSSDMAFIDDLHKSQLYISGNLDEMYESRRSLQDWIQQHTVPLVGKLTNTNFQLYDKIGKPMLMLFLDLQRERYTTGPNVLVGGKTGGLLNQDLIDELTLVAKEHKEKFSFVYLDGHQHQVSTHTSLSSLSLFSSLLSR